MVLAFVSAASTPVPKSGQSFFTDDIFVRDARPPADLALTRYGRSGRREAF